MIRTSDKKACDWNTEEMADWGTDRRRQRQNLTLFSRNAMRVEKNYVNRGGNWHREMDSGEIA